MTAQPRGQIKPPYWGQLKLIQPTTTVAEVPDQGEQSTATAGLPVQIPIGDYNIHRNKPPVAIGLPDHSVGRRAWFASR